MSAGESRQGNGGVVEGILIEPVREEGYELTLEEKYCLIRLKTKVDAALR
jgi:hypothetical protein